MKNIIDRYKIVDNILNTFVSDELSFVVREKHWLLSATLQIEQREITNGKN